MNIIQKPANTANFSQGRFGAAVNMIVHHTMQGWLGGTDSWFANPASKVSAHYGIGLNGEIHQYVDESNTAWHAGLWNVNIASVGIEYEDAVKPFKVVRTPEQYAAGAWLSAQIAGRHGFANDLQHNFGHNQVSPTHPNCPGNLDVKKIVAPVVAPLGGRLDAMVEIIVDTLNTRTTPSIGSNIATHPDGSLAQLHRGTAHVNGFTTGQQVTMSATGKTDKIWLLTDGGHWFTQTGANSSYGHGQPMTGSRYMHLGASQLVGLTAKARNNILRRNK